MTWPTSGNPAGWNRSRPATGSNRATSTSGYSALRAPAAVIVVIVLFSLSAMEWLSLRATRSQPAFDEHCAFVVWDREESRCQQSIGILGLPLGFGSNQWRSSDRIATGRQAQGGFELT